FPFLLLPLRSARNTNRQHHDSERSDGGDRTLCGFIPCPMKKKRGGIFLFLESLSIRGDARHLGDNARVVQAREKRSQDENSTWTIFADVHATSRSYERQGLSKREGSRIYSRETGRDVDAVRDPAEARKGEKDLWRLWLCNAKARRQRSTHRGPAGPVSNYHQRPGTKQIWNLRLLEWPG